MKFEVFEEPFDEVRSEAVELLNLTRLKKTDESRFEWLYQQNPDGPAVFWSVRDINTGEMAGFTVALPRRMIVDSQTRMAWNGADFSMHPRYRTLGPAVKLRRAARQGVDDGRVDFLYSHPNDKMAAIHKRVGHLPIGRMVRFARVVRSTPYLRDRLGNTLLARTLGTFADPLLTLVSRESRHRGSHDVNLVSPARFDNSFDKLFEDSSSKICVVGVRDSQYLNWRYAQNPIYESHVLVAKAAGRVSGYLVFMIRDDVLHIKDVFPPTNLAAVRDLLAEALRIARRKGLRSVSFIVLESSLLLPTLQEFSFRMRMDSSQMFGHTPPESPVNPTVLLAASWFLTVGDRDV